MNTLSAREVREAIEGLAKTEAFLATLVPTTAMPIGPLFMAQGAVSEALRILMRVPVEDVAVSEALRMLMRAAAP